MTKRRKKGHQVGTSYSFNKTKLPLPDLGTDKIKPPITSEAESKNDSLKAEKKQELSLDEQAQQYMDAYRKAERVVINNFYTGGGAYKRGVLDSIYRGFNPLNP